LGEGTNVIMHDSAVCSQIIFKTDSPLML